MPSITLCMIVRDEETMLARCLASAREAVDEMVIVDTGSRDATKRLAADAGARVFDFVWCDDFAAARNEALRHAHGDWMLVLDADERLTPRGCRALRAAVRRAKFDCGLLKLHDAARVDADLEEVVSGRERQAEIQLVPRLLRRARDLAYVDPIHENVLPWLRRRGMKIAGLDVDIVHLGATAQVVDAKSKLDRNMRLLRARLDADAADVTAYGYLAHDLLRTGAVDEALECAERGWTHVSTAARADGPSIHRLATARAFLLIQRRRFAEARETVRIGRSIEGDSPDFAFLAACAFESEALGLADPLARRDGLAAAARGYGECLGFRDRLFAQSFVVGASSWGALTRLGIVELLMDRPAEALRAFDAALALRPGEREPRLGRAEAILESGNAGGALVAIEGLLDDSSPDGWTLAAIAVQALGHRHDARLFARRAQALLAKGFVAPHRRSRLRGILDSLSQLEISGVEAPGVSQG